MLYRSMVSLALAAAASAPAYVSAQSGAPVSFPFMPTTVAGNSTLPTTDGPTTVMPTSGMPTTGAATTSGATTSAPTTHGATASATPYPTFKGGCPVPKIEKIHPNVTDGKTVTPITIVGTGFSYGSNAFFIDSTNNQVAYSAVATNYSLFKQYANGSASLVVNTPSCQAGNPLTVHLYSTCGGVDQGDVRVNISANACVVNTRAPTPSPTPAPPQCTSGLQPCGSVSCYNPSTQYCNAGGNGGQGTVTSIQQTTTISLPSSVFTTGNAVSTSSVVYGGICATIYQEGSLDATCNVINPQTGQYFQQCYNPSCYNCTATGQLCPASAPLSCGAACYDPGMYSCQVNTQNYFSSQLQQVPNGKSTLSLPDFCPGSGSPLAGTTPASAPSSGQSVSGTPSGAIVPAAGFQNTTTTTSSICSQIYQEGAQDQTCHVLNPATGQSTPQCYNPACYNCTAQFQLCPANAPMSCGVACFDPNEYSCNVNQNNYYASTLQQIPGGKHVLTLNPYCPGSGSPLAGTTPNTTVLTPPTAPASGQQCISQVAPTPTTSNDVVSNTSTICSQIYQEGAQDASCYILDPTNGQSTLQCYNPTCYNCTTTGQLCPANFPYACGVACYDPNEYSCNINHDNFFQSTLQQISGGKHTLSLNPYCPGSGSPLAGTTPQTTTVTPPAGASVSTSTAAPTAAPTQANASYTQPPAIVPASAVTNGSFTPGAYVSNSICSQIYQEGAQDHSCNVIDPQTGSYFEQCYNPACYNCTATGQLCPANAPLSCGAACYDPGMYSCNVDSNNYFNSQLQQVPNGKSTLTLNEYCPGSGSPLAGTTPKVTTTPAAPATGAQVVCPIPSPPVIIPVPVPSTPVPTTVMPTAAASVVTDICSQIYQEGAQDHSCNVLNPSTGQYTLQCYNPACYNCSSYGTLCPANFPMSCGVACYDPNEYSCNVNQQDFFASTLQQIPGGKHTMELYAYCPGSGSPLAGTTPNTTITVAPQTGSQQIAATSAPTSAATTKPTTVAPTTVAATTAQSPLANNTVPIYKPQTTTTTPVTANAVVPAANLNQPLLSTGTCSTIYQEGAQDSTCNVMNPTTGSTTTYCYNPSCYNCTATGFLCPVNTPMSCGGACYSPQQYTCIVNTNNLFASTLQYIANSAPLSPLPAFCPGSGSPLAGTTPNSNAVRAPVV